MISSSPFRRRPRPGSPEQGYVLLMLMMLAAMVVIVLAAGLPFMKQQVQRDQEQEMIHRGVQYSRAIRKYYKKFGRYPTRLEELDNTNNLRFLRKHYKDPITGQDFKLLHFGEVQMAFGAGIAGGVAPGANAMGSVPAPKSNDQAGDNQPSSQDSSQNSSDNSGSNNPGSPANSGSNNPGSPAPFGNQAAFGGQTFGG